MYRYRGRVLKNQKKRIIQTLTRQIIICIIIILLILVAKKMDILLVNNALETFHTQISKDYTTNDIGTGIKTAFTRVKQGSKTMVATFRMGEKRMEFSVPADVEGTLSASASGEDVGKTMEFQAEKEIQVYAAAGGTVSEIGDSGNNVKYIKISHGNQIISLYGGCTEVYVRSLEKVRKGQIIGSVPGGADRHLLFEIWVDGKLANPVDYIKY